jgi:hypothetical protein
MRLPQPGRPGPRIYIPQEQGGPIIHLGTGLAFRRRLSLLCNGYRGLFILGKGGRDAKLTTHFHLVTSSRMVKLYLHFPICLHGVTIKRKVNFNGNLTLYSQGYFFLLVRVFPSPSGGGARERGNDHERPKEMSPPISVQWKEALYISREMGLPRSVSQYTVKRTRHRVSSVFCLHTFSKHSE